MAYPQGIASDNFSSGIYTSDFSPAIVCGGILDNHTPVNNVGMKNSIGYQLSLTQNFVNEQYLGRDLNRIETGWINNLHASGINLDSVSEHATIISSGIMHLMSPEAAIAGLTISGNYIGIMKNDPEYEMDIYGSFRTSYSNYGGIRLYGDNGFFNYVAADADETQELFLQTSTQDAGFVHVNPQEYGGVALNDQFHATMDNDVWSSSSTFTSGIINWSDCTISGFLTYS